MSNDQKTHLLDLLTKSYSATRTVIKSVDLDLQVYSDPAWQVRDILWHLAVWDRQVTKSIEAFQNGDEYVISDYDEDVFNNSAFQEGRKLSGDQVLMELNQARQAFQHAVQQFPIEQFDAEFLYPWGDETGDVVQLVKFMVEHYQEHRAEIAAAVNS